MRTMIQSVLVSVLLGGFTVVAAQLPPDIMVDRYLLKAEQAVRAGDLATARAAMERVVSLQQEHGLEPEPEDHYRYAQAWEAAGEPERAMAAAVRYLQLQGREAAHYTEALDLMNRAESASAASAAEISEGSRVEPPKVPQLPPGVTGEGAKEAVVWYPPPPDIKPELPQAADCTLWRNNNSYEFFETANLEDVKACLDAGANPMAPMVLTENGITSLHAAAKFSDDPAVIEALLEAGADIGARTVKKDGKNTPLHTAARFNENAEIIRFWWRPGPAWRRGTSRKTHLFTGRPGLTRIRRSSRRWWQPGQALTQGISGGELLCTGRPVSTRIQRSSRRWWQPGQALTQRISGGELLCTGRPRPTRIRRSSRP